MPVVDLTTGESAAMAPCPHTGFDNGYNLPEMSIGPSSTLTGLNNLVMRKLKQLSRHLQGLGLGLTNFSEHPFVSITPEFYKNMCVPRPIYKYWREVRKWDHSSGIDAKAHMSPSLQVQAHRAVDAVNIMLGFAPAFIGIYANSPFETGAPTGNVENRLTLWTRMFEGCAYPSDRENGKRTDYFRSLEDYFEWIYGDNLIHALPGSHDNFKACKDLFVPLEPVSYNDFYSSKGIETQGLIHSEKRFIAPTVYHQEYFQFSKFPDARIRFFLRDNYTPRDFMNKLRNFAEITPCVYIEMRAPGTNLPDRFIRETAGDRIADSVIISVCALMKGLLTNMDKALSNLPQDFFTLRQAAMKHSMAHDPIRTLSANAIEIAREGLAPEERWMLAYPEYVVQTGISNGMRGLGDYGEGRSLRDMVLDRVVSC